MGKIFRFHNDVDTDQIIASQYLLFPTIEEMKSHTFESLDPEFPQKVQPGDFVVAGENFGCGSSREQAPEIIKALKIKCVIAKSYARIHCANLANAGLIPLQFVDEADYDRIDQMDELRLPRIKEELKQGTQVTLEDVTKGFTIQVEAQLTQRQREMVLAGGLLNYTKHQAE